MDWNSALKLPLPEPQRRQDYLIVQAEWMAPPEGGVIRVLYDIQV